MSSASTDATDLDVESLVTKDLLVLSKDGVGEGRVERLYGCELVITLEYRGGGSVAF